MLRRGRVERELEEELAFHLEARIREEVAGGASPEEARRRALLALEGVERCKEECRDARRVRLVADLVSDLGYAARMMRKSPAFAATAALTIALGIGASTAMFSVVNAVLLRPLPYGNADRLVRADPFVSNAAFFDLREGTRGAFEDMSAVMVYRAVVPREDGTAERISKGQVTTNFMRMMGARVALGRDFTDADGQPPARPEPLFPPSEGAVAILSHEYFERRYGGNARAIGQEMLSLGRRGPRIVGVLAPGFRMVGVGTEPSPDVWIPNNRGYDAAHRGDLMLTVMGRLKEGVTPARAQAQADVVISDWRRTNPDVVLDMRFKPLKEVVVAEVRPAILALMGAVTFLGLIACANVANLLLVRASLRERELAMRAALGAGRGRLVRQMLAEAAALAAAGTVAGVALAWLGVHELLRIVPENLARVESVAIDWRVLAFAALAGLAEAAFVGAIPAWRAARAEGIGVLRGAGRTAGLAAGRRLRQGVVIAEAALSFVLLVGCGLMVRSFTALQRIDPGYDSRGLLTFLLIGDARGVEPAGRAAFVREIRDRLQAMPGVASVSGSTFFPLKGGFFGGGEWSSEPGKLRAADFQTVLPGYFGTLRTRVIAGRTFREADNAPGRNVAVIDETLAGQAFRGGW